MSSLRPVQWTFWVTEISGIVGRHSHKREFCAKSSYLHRTRPEWLRGEVRYPQFLVDMAALASAPLKEKSSWYWKRRERNKQLGVEMEGKALQKYVRQVGEHITELKPTLKMVQTTGGGVPYMIVGRPEAIAGDFVLEVKTREKHWRYPPQDKDQCALYSVMSKHDARLIQQKQADGDEKEVKIADMPYETCVNHYTKHLKPRLDAFVELLEDIRLKKKQNLKKNVKV